MKVEIWSDVVCPWCYVGKRRFESALARFEHREQVQVRWRSFELDPRAVSGQPGDEADYAGRLAAKYGMPREQAEQRLTSMTQTAAAEGLELHFGTALPSNTFDAHQVIHLAAEHGLDVQDAVKERLMLAYFTQGEAIGRHDVLIRLGAEAGLDAQDVRSALESQRFAQAVRDDQSQARALGISGVPFFVVDQRYGVSGAQSPDVLLQTLQKAWAESMPLNLVAAAGGGDACGPDGCAP